MSDHHCEGLRKCDNHPKWRVVKLPWFIFQYSVVRPGNRVAGHFRTHTAAIHYAQKEATR